MSWTAPEQQRQPDQRLHGHAVHRHDRPDPGHGQQRLRDLGDRHRADQRAPPTRSRSRPPTPSAPAPRRRPPPRSRPRTRSSTSPPRRPSTPATRAVELGVKFTADTSGTVTGIRFYKAATNTGTHIGSLWSSTGTLLATATFTGETASGWQTVAVRHPGHDHRRHDLRRRLLAPNGHYSVTAGRSTPASTTRRCTRSPTPPAPTASTPTARRARFPTNSYSASNYWVDVPVRRRRRARPGRRASAPPPGTTRRDRHLDGAASGGADDATRSRRTSARPPRRRRPSTARRRRRARRSPG